MSVYGFYSVDPMPNQPSVAWCSDFTVYIHHRGKGFAHWLKREQNGVLKNCGFTLAMCSVKESNSAQIRVLQHAGWTYVISFNDVRTGEHVQIWNYRVDQDR